MWYAQSPSVGKIGPSKQWSSSTCTSSWWLVLVLTIGMIDNPCSRSVVPPKLYAARFFKLWTLLTVFYVIFPGILKSFTAPLGGREPQFRNHCSKPSRGTRKSSISWTFRQDVNEFTHVISGAYAEWIDVNSDVMADMLPLLVAGLSHADAAPSASMALKDITRDCAPSIRPFAPLILAACQVRPL